MLPVTHTESPQSAAERQANFVLLRSLESKLPSPIFESVLNTVIDQIDLPKRIDWKGFQKNLTFDELKINFSHIDQNFLPELLRSVLSGSNQEISRFKKNDQFKLFTQPRVKAMLGKHQNILQSLKSSKLGNFETDQKLNLKNFEISRFNRMKTVFGHAIMEEGSCASIYNVHYDKSGKFIISGADDGIIKIWDTDTLNLQASLHGHTDYITDLDFKIKKENSSKTGDEYIQILVTCSEDGTVKVYDFTNYNQGEQLSQSKQNSQSNTEGQGRQLRRQEQNQNRRDRFYLCLTPEDFRPGSRNKKIESVNVNSQGIVVAGTNTGDIFLWKLDFSQFRTKQPERIQFWIGANKRHTKCVHFTEFSPSGKFLFTGSVDGTAKIWNMEYDKKSKKESVPNKLIELNDERLKVTLEEKRASFQCDCIAWSAFGRYAIASISGKIEENKNIEQSFIKVWDSLTGKVTQDLAKGNNIQLLNYSFVLTPHPIFEEILLTGSQGGLLALWNLKTKQLIKKFVEYGVYSIDKYTLNDPFDGRFSPDGSSFVVGSMLGTISLFSCSTEQHKYEYTRVEQFFPYDDSRHSTNIHQQLEEEPQVCGFSLIPYEIQPPSSIIGKFKNHRNLTNEEYQRELVIRKEMCAQEEEFINHQLEDGLRNNFFNAEEGVDFSELQQHQQQIDHEDEEEIPFRRARNRIDDGNLSQIDGDGNLQGSQEDEEILNGLNHAADQSRRNQNGRRRVIINRAQYINANPNVDPENSLYDRESDENFEVEESEQSEEEQQSQDEQPEEYKFQRENYHQTQQNRRQQRQTQLDEQLVISRQELAQRQQETREERALRRQKRLYDDISEEKYEINSDDSQDNKQLRKSRRNQIHDESDEEDYDMSDIQNNQQKRRRLKRTGGSNRPKYDLPSSDEESLKSKYQSDEEDFLEKKEIKKKKEPKRQKENKSQRRTRRNNRVKYTGMDESESDEDNQEMNTELEEVKEEVKTRGNKRKVIQDESDQSEEVEMIDTTTKNKTHQYKGDEDYELLLTNEQRVSLEEEMIDTTQNKHCTFCRRIDQPLIGPFVKQNQRNVVTDGPHYFHKDCIEVNKYSFYNKSKNKWINIGKALNLLVNKKQYTCKRCETKGATIQCCSCSKYYHGYLCSQLYMIWKGGQEFQCFECRNTENHEQFLIKPPNMDNVLDIYKSINRDHMLASKTNGLQYIPQINDIVYYFFQGHERFLQEYNCYFYSGESDQLLFDQPWKLYPELQSATQCKIINIGHTFPSVNSLYLIKKFGKSSSEVVQIPQVIFQLELQILNEPDKIFFIDFFPNDLPDFLVLKDQYEISSFTFNYLHNDNKVIGNTFNTNIKNNYKVKVIDIQPKEPTLYEFSQWETIRYQYQENYRLRDRVGRRGQRRGEQQENEAPVDLMNFWEIIFEESKGEEKYNIQCAFEGLETERLINIILEYIEKKKDNVSPFKSRVEDKIAPDYRCHVRAEMYLDLIVERLQNKYYRTQEQLFFDLDLISYNARLYNGDDEPLTRQAKKVVEQIRCELRRHMNSVGEKRQSKEESKISLNFNVVGKLTAPTRLDSQLTTFDVFREQQLQENGNRNNNINQIDSKEESKTNIKIRDRNSKENIMHNGDENFRIQIDQSESIPSTESKITPKLNNINTNISTRRQTRNSARVNYDENLMNNLGNGTGEKKLKRKEEQAQQDDNMLGKRTRKCRQRGLNEQFNQDFEEDNDESSNNQNHKQVQGRDQTSNSRYPKRIRN